jgi:IS30 family transposase
LFVGWLLKVELRKIMNAVSISKRPPKVEDRDVANVANKDTQSVPTALVKQTRKLPKELYKSLTWDWGSEMSGHQKSP